ncbi:Transcription termination factor 2 [Sergentomyia squamirostris]
MSANEEDQSNASASSEDPDESDVELPETESENDADESVVVKPRSTRRLRILSDSEDERSFDRHVLSPKARKSMGLKSLKMPSDSEESDVGSLFEDEPSASKDESRPRDTSKTSQNGNKSSDVDTSFDKSVLYKLSSTRYSSVHSPKTTSPEVDSIADRLKEATLMDNEVVTIDSDDEVERSVSGDVNHYVKEEAPEDKLENGIQKITVSHVKFREEEQKLNQLLDESEATKELYKKYSKTLPDNGAQLTAKINSIAEAIDSQMKYVSLLEPEADAEPEIIRLDSFDDVEEKIQSDRGRAKFETQKLVTVETLQNIHKSLNNYPPEDALMEQPDGIKVTLMDHQRYALTYMCWREKNDPRGGILGDDMGTGKTLTMIALILLDQSRGGDDSDEDDSSQPQWRSTAAKKLPVGGTLVVCPPSLLQQWSYEVKNKCRKKTIEGCLHHGQDRFTSGRRLAKYDIVLTTYPTLNSELIRGGALFKVNWRRVVLDEGHVIRNHKTGIAKACFELETSRRWILTGTPIHNNIKDLYSVMKFLRCSPFDNIEYWNLFVGKKNAEKGGIARVHAILKIIMLRRTKQQLQEKGILQSMPEREVKIVTVTLSNDEQILYQKFLLYSQTLFAEYLKERKEFNMNDERIVKKTRAMCRKVAEYANQVGISTTQIFVLILRLRQICCHPSLLNISQNEDVDIDGVGNVSNEAGTSRSSDNLVNLINQLDLCDENTDINVPVLKYRKNILLKDIPSTKVTVILEKIEEVIKKGDKLVLVSQWTSFLDIIQIFLRKRHLGFMELTGKTKIEQRGQIIAQFNNPDDPVQILLLSLQTGGVGLNLVGGNHLFLLDPHWNPQLELQAQDRVYRIGQTKPVTIYKFVTAGSIEERIIVMQQKKTELADSVLTGVNKGKGSGLNIADLRMLFNM